jgi:hypothetical protein
LGIEHTLVIGPVFRRLEVDTNASDNPWDRVDHAIAALDFVKESNRLNALIESSWDLVIIDAPLSMTVGSARGTAVQAIWQSKFMRMVVLSGGAWNRVELSRETAPDPLAVTVVKIPPLPSLGRPEVVSRVEHVPLTTEERALLTEVRDRLGPVAAGAGSASAVAALLMRRASSSIYALDLSVRSLLATIRPRVFTGSGGATTDPRLEESIDPYYLLSDVSDEWTLTSSGGFTADQLEPLLDLFDEVNVDSKLELLARLLSGGDRNRLPVVFAEFADTALYVAEGLRERGIEASIITGTTSERERVLLLGKARDENAVLVLTTAGAFGFEASFAGGIIHFDLPSTELQWSQRLGRVFRLGSDLKTKENVVLLDGVLTSDDQAALWTRLGIVR